MAQISTIEINTAPAKKSIADLEQELDNTNKALKQLDMNSAAFADLQKQAASLKGQLDQVNRTTDTLSKGFQGWGENMAKVTAGISGGITAVTAGMQLMGVENENVVAGIAKLQQLMAFTQGISSLKDLSEGFKNLKGAVKTVTGSFKGLKGAIIGTGIGALVVALGMLIENWDKVTAAIDEFIGSAGNASKVTAGLDAAFTAIKTTIVAVGGAIVNFITTPFKSIINAVKAFNETEGSMFDKLKAAGKAAKTEVVEAWDETKEDFKAIGTETAKAYNKSIDDQNKEAERKRKEEREKLAKERLAAAKKQAEAEAKAAQEAYNNAVKNIGYRRALIEYNKEFDKSYAASAKALQDEIKLQQELLSIVESRFGIESTEYLEQKTKLKRLENEYKETFDILAKYYGKFDEQIFQELKKSNLFIFDPFTGESLNEKLRSDLDKIDIGKSPLRTYLTTLYEDGIKLYDQLQSNLSKYIAEGLSFDDAEQKILEEFASSNFFDSFFIGWGENIKKIKIKLNDLFKEGIIDRETLINLRNQVTASFEPITKITGLLGQNLAKQSSNLLNDYSDINDDVEYFYEDRLIFLIDYYKRKQEIEQKDYSFEIENAQNLLNIYTQKRQAAASLTESIIRDNTTQFRLLQDQYDAEKEQLKEALDNKLLAYEEYYEAVTALGRINAQNQVAAAAGVASNIADILSSAADNQDQNNKEGFERAKKLQVAAATINMLTGVTTALSGLFTTKTGPWDIALAVTQAAAIAAAGLVNIRKIQNQTYDSSSSVSASVGSSTITPPTQYTQAVENANLETKLGDTRVFVLESDIQRVGKRVSIQESENTY